MDPTPSSDPMKKNRIVPLQIPPPQSNSESDKPNGTTKETVISNPSSTINSARTDQPLLMSTPQMPLIPKIALPQPQLIPFENGRPKLSIGTPDISAAKKKKHKTNKSIQKGNGLLVGGRVDGHGYPIIKGGKNHKIMFRDEVAKVILVESYKRYNMENTNEATKSCLRCLCQIF